MYRIFFIGVLTVLFGCSDQVTITKDEAANNIDAALNGISEVSANFQGQLSTEEIQMKFASSEYAMLFAENYESLRAGYGIEVAQDILSRQLEKRRTEFADQKMHLLKSGLPCYSTWVRDTGLALTGFLACGGIATSIGAGAMCFSLWGATQTVIDAEFDDCIEELRKGK